MAFHNFNRILRSHSRIGKLTNHFAHASKMVALSLLTLLSFSCSHENGPSSPRVTFHVDMLAVDRDSTFCNSNGTPSPSRAPQDAPSDISLSQANMTDLWLFEGTTLLAHQVSTDTKFGSPQVELSYGSHTITFIASSQSGQTFANGIWSANRAADCFGYVATINVSSANSTESIVLNRCTYGLKWQSTDLVPAGTRTLRLSISPMRESMAAGLIATNPYTRTYTYDVSSYIGKTVGVTVYGLPERYAVEESITTTIEFLSSTDAVLFSHTKSVPVLTNRRTIISGPLFNGSASAPVRINSQWLADYETNI